MKIIIDSNGLAYRALYSMGGLSYGTRQTGVIYGFLKEILQLAERFNTNQFVFCWDSRQSYRKLIDPSYKSGRENIPEDQRQMLTQAYIQFDALRDEILPSMGFQRIYMQSGYESDDLIAWLIYRRPDEYMIVTGDDDLLQLLGKHNSGEITIYNISQKNIVKEQDFINKYGLKPSDWSRVKAIGGCTSDNVKGIPGVGPGSAIKYINNVLKDGGIKKKIDSEEGKKITQDCMRLVHLPFNGDRDINIAQDANEYYKDDQFSSLNFISTFRNYGCGSFTSSDGFNRWRKAFNLISGK